MKKVCSKCKELKLLSDFHKHKRDGHLSQCKQCFINYYRSKDTCTRKIYLRMKHRTQSNYRQKSYHGRKLLFTWKDFLAWIPTSNLDQVYDNWVDNGYPRKLAPSIDRIDNDSDYTLGNIQIITQGENVRKDKKGGKHHNAKLTAKQVVKIRQLYATNDYSQSQLATTFGVSQPHINEIINYKSWAKE